MLKSIRIENFRGFHSFELQQLGRVNLLVGKNNTGKTSILEAIQLLCSRNKVDLLAQKMTSRSEFCFDEKSNNSLELDVRHLFYGHEIQLETRFAITATHDNSSEELVVSIKAHNIHIPEGSRVLDAYQNDEFIKALLERDSFLEISWNGTEKEPLILLPLSSKGGLPIDYVRRFRGDNKNSASKVQFVTSSFLETERMIELFDQIVLTPEEKLVEQALNIIDSKIKRIAPMGSIKFRGSLDGSRGGFFVLLSDINQRVPIGSMGDGVWRMLGLALATVCAKDGYLFVDEIDTGLHFTAMSDMWRMIWETAKRLNVQVFATTHNSDCWMSLASIVQQEDAAEDGIRIHRIEKGKEKSVVFTEPQIVIAAEREIEVR
ncbi:AAA family ATPase [Trichormus variabilis ARAD]|nr:MULTISPECIES: ATP-binding protein [Nostocaceae]MBC1216197.1 AAA family ATPase [Trichormus variabilis ARAD]MBC1255792.1 AAA family ATPase [Trichormus variabilis V5]MBC1268627.1 AAA family ATPase [Trichormus variabilis FSR]MBC1304660.1 AAA family ATPase [Trichormus variabilis N2B]MBC1313527.1 AAA family ATPase [Trichormus variabilis PNB]